MHFEDGKYLKEEEMDKVVKMASLGACTRTEISEHLERLEAMFVYFNESVEEVEELMRQTDLREEDINDDGIVKSYGLDPSQVQQLPSNREIRNKTKKCMEELIQIRDSLKNFDKVRCFANIRALMKDKDVKVGQIEKEAGVRAGYVARLEKPDNTAEPSVEFIMTAAKMLDVSVDFLMNAKINEVTPNEEYILKFIKRVVSDTESGAMFWKRESCRELNAVHNDYEAREKAHPLFMYDMAERDNSGRMYIARYGSTFFPYNAVDVMGNAYNAKLPGTDTRFYIVPCNILDEEDSLESLEDRFCYEIYLEESRDVTPICNSLLTCDIVRKAIADLYKRIEEATSHIQLNDKAKSIIDRYMGRQSFGTQNIGKNTGFLDISADEEMPF